MSPRPNLKAVDAMDDTIEIDMDDVMEALAKFQSTEFGGDDDPPSDPMPTKYRHQLLNFDFWFFAASTFSIMLIFTSFIASNWFEILCFAALVLNCFGIVANLTREKQGLIIHRVHHHFAINIRLPRWAGFGYTPADKPLIERI